LACISRHVHAQADARHISTLEDFGVEFVHDTCWCMLLDEPIVPADPDAVILTNSGKYAHYGPALTNRRLRLGSTSDCIRAASTGVHDTNRRPPWLRNATHKQQRRTYATATQTIRMLLRKWR
jgi:hypothetical protein